MTTIRRGRSRSRDGPLSRWPQPRTSAAGCAGDIALMLGWLRQTLQTGPVPGLEPGSGSREAERRTDEPIWDEVRPGENGELSTVSITGGHQHRLSQKYPLAKLTDRGSNPTEEQREQAFAGLALPSSRRLFPLEAAASRKTQGADMQ